MATTAFAVRYLNPDDKLTDASFDLIVARDTP